MKNSMRYIYILFLASCLISCEKEGPVGPQGKQGVEGQQGIPGTDSNVILYGNAAPSNNVGKVGDFFIDKTTSRLYGPKTGSDWGTPVNLGGASGTSAMAGSQFLTGDKAPENSLGKPGDFYFDTESGQLFGPKSNDNTWTQVTSLKGQQGDAGSANIYSSDWIDFDWTGKLGESWANFDYDFSHDVSEMLRDGSSVLVYFRTKVQNGVYQQYAIPLMDRTDQMYDIVLTIGDYEGRYSLWMSLYHTWPKQFQLIDTEFFHQYRFVILPKES